MQEPCRQEYEGMVPLQEIVVNPEMSALKKVVIIVRILWSIGFRLAVN